MRPPRRCKGTSAVRERANCVQPSSNAGGGSLDLSGGGAAGGGMRGSAADGSIVRVSARSRSFRDDEENNRLRRGLTAGAASAVGGTAGGSLRPRSRAAASSCQGAGETADGGAAGSV